MKILNLQFISDCKVYFIIDKKIILKISLNKLLFYLS